MAREAAFKKRILQDADANVAQLLPAAKKAKAGTANSTAGPVPAPVRIPTTRSTLQGPAGEAMMPRVMPIEWDHVIGKVPIPSSWIVAVDATPDRSMTLGSRCWWVELGQWYKANKKDLTLKSRDWHKRKEALSKPEEPKGDEGLHDWDFVCVEAPTDNEDDEDGPPRRNHDKSGPVGKLASLHPSHPWCISLKGRNRGLWWMFETFKRDPDEFGLLFYDDFAVYGGMEVLENMFDLFAKVCKLSADYRDVWCEVEGLALLLSRTADFSACDDPDKLGQLVELMGHMCLTALRIIKEQGALNTTGTIPNFGFVFSLLIEGVWEMGQCTAVPAAHTSWIYALLDMAEDAGIEIIGTPGYESTLKSIEDDRRDNHSTASKEKWEKSNFQARLKSYKAKHGGHKGPRSTGALGGSHYDITKLTAAERSDYSGENTLLLERLSRAWASRDRSTSLGEIREWGDTDFLNELLNGAEG